MKVDRKQLLSKMKMCLPGVDSGNLILDGADSFVFKDKKIYSYNESLYVMVPLDTELDGTVKAKEFFDIVTKLTTDELTIVVRENKWIIKSGKAQVQLALQDNNIVQYVEAAETGAGKWNKLPEDFMEAMAACKFGCNRSNIRGIFVNDTHMCSSDDMRINFYKMDSKMPQFWIDDPAAGELMKVSGMKKVRLTKAWAEFQNTDGTIFSCKRLMDEKYPFDKLKGIIDSHGKDDDDLSNTIDASFKQVIERASIFSTDMEGYESIGVKFTPKHLECFSERATGSFKEKVKWEKPFETEFEEMVMYFDSSSIGYGLARTNEFYIKCIPSKKSDKIMKRVIFFNEKYTHLISTVS